MSTYARNGTSLRAELRSSTTVLPLILRLSETHEVTLSDDLATIQIRNGAARLDTDALMAAYPVVSNPGFYRPALVTAEIRKRIAPVDLEPFTVHGTPTVVVR